MATPTNADQELKRQVDKILWELESNAVSNIEKVAKTAVASKKTWKAGRNATKFEKALRDLDRVMKDLDKVTGDFVDLSVTVIHLK